MTIDIKELQKTKDTVISKIAVIEQMEKESEIKKLELKNKLSDLSEESIDILRNNGIYIDNILNMDYDKLGKDYDYTLKMQEEVHKVIGDIMVLVKELL